MRILAKIKIDYANEDERKKIESLFRNARGQLKPVPISEILTPMVRFASNLSIEQKYTKDYTLEFDILGVY